MKLAVWSPLPPSPSGIADYVAEALPRLAERISVTAVVEDPSTVDPDLRARFTVVRAGEEGEPDLDLYHLGNSPAHAYVYRACRRRPGVAFLHEWSLHHLVLSETVEKGDADVYLRLMRRAYGETGTFVGRQVARGLGGDLLPARFPLNEPVLENSLAVVALTRTVRERARRALGERPTLHLPHHVFLPPGAELPRQEARRRLGLPPAARIVTAPGLATAAKRLHVAVRVIGGLRRRLPDVRLVVAGEVDPRLPLGDWAAEQGMDASLIVTGRLSLVDFVRHLCAADVTLALRFPSHGEISGALLRTLGVGRPALVSAGTPASEEFPEGVVVPIDPGPYEEGEMSAVLERLLGDPPLAERMGALARVHVERAHALPATVDTLRAFLERVAGEKQPLLDRLQAGRTEAAGLFGYLMDEVLQAARELGLPALPPGTADLLRELAGGTP